MIISAGKMLWNACENVAFSALGKTGRHFDELATILEEMREESNG
jgi:hypothetical protein